MHLIACAYRNQSNLAFQFSARFSHPINRNDLSYSPQILGRPVRLRFGRNIGRDHQGRRWHRQSEERLFGFRDDRTPKEGHGRKSIKFFSEID